MPLSGLATVELRLIMHCLDTCSLLALARCSQCTLTAASADFGWKMLSPLLITLSQHSLPFTASISSSLLRFCNVALQWSPSSPESERHQLHAIHALARLTSLDLSLRSTTKKCFRSLMSGENITKLTSLHERQCAVDADFQPLLVTQLQRLSRLSVVLSSSPFPRCILSIASNLQNLTHLSVQSIESGDKHALAAIGKCTGLRSLTLLCFCQSEVQLILSHPNLQSLQCLTLDQSRRSETPVDWPRVFQPMQLRELSLIECAQVRDFKDIVEASVRCCSCLERVLLQSKDLNADSKMLRASHLEQLLRSLPAAVHLTLKLTDVPHRFQKQRLDALSELASRWSQKMTLLFPQ
jgi:hypothetical protein